MSDLKLEATTSTPSVELIKSEEVGRMRGDSYPPNAYEFFQPIVAWLRDHLQRGDGFLLELDLPYMNTSSIKWMLDILELLDEAHRNGKHVRVRWRHDRENERAAEVIEDFQEDLSLQFEVEPY